MTASSPGKTWNLAGLHCGFVVLQSPLHREKYLAVVEPANLHFGSAFATAGMLAAYTHGGEWCVRVRRYIESQVKCLEAFLLKDVPEIVAVRPQASFLCWLDCSRLGLEAVEGGAQSPLCVFMLEEAKVMLSDGWSFGGAPTAHFQRINVACSRQVLLEGLGRIAAAVTKRRPMV